MNCRLSWFTLCALSFRNIRYVQKCQGEDLRRFGCSICSKWLAYPIELGCGHRFCGSCLIEYLEQGIHSNCPQCDEKLDSIDRFDFLGDEMVLDTVNRKCVHCRHSVVGCGWTGQRSRLVKHLASECKVSYEFWLCSSISSSLCYVC